MLHCAAACDGGTQRGDQLPAEPRVGLEAGVQPDAGAVADATRGDRSPDARPVRRDAGPVADAAGKPLPGGSLSAYVINDGYKTGEVYLRLAAPVADVASSARLVGSSVAPQLEAENGARYRLRFSGALIKPGDQLSYAGARLPIGFIAETTFTRADRFSGANEQPGEKPFTEFWFREKHSTSLNNSLISDGKLIQEMPKNGGATIRSEHRFTGSSEWPTPLVNFDQMPEGAHYLFAFNTRFTAYNPAEPNKFLIWQVHSTSGSPPLALEVHQGGEFHFTVHFPKRASTVVGKLAVGKTYHWLLSVRQHQTDGLTELWLRVDGGAWQRVIDRRGQPSFRYDGKDRHYLKIGWYAWDGLNYTHRFETDYWLAADGNHGTVEQLQQRIDDR